MRDMQRLCISCEAKQRCEHELTQGSAARHYREFCPNAFTLDALFEQQKQLPLLKDAAGVANVAGAASHRGRCGRRH
jgi:hypothetical protein